MCPQQCVHVYQGIKQYNFVLWELNSYSSIDLKRSLASQAALRSWFCNWWWSHRRRRNFAQIHILMAMRCEIERVCPCGILGFLQLYFPQLRFRDIYFQLSEYNLLTINYPLGYHILNARPVIVFCPQYFFAFCKACWTSEISEKLFTKRSKLFLVSGPF